jgi:hypothetical protein
VLRPAVRHSCSKEQLLLPATAAEAVALLLWKGRQQDSSGHEFGSSKKQQKVRHHTSAEAISAKLTNDRTNNELQ